LVVAVLGSLGLAGCKAPPGKQPDLDITRPISPVAPLPTETWRPGMIVWLDLVTPDLESAIEFYSEVFGWRFVLSEHRDYAEVSHEGVMLGSCALYSGDGDVGRWLISISAKDVDGAAAEVARRGGEVLVPPEDVQNRGRYTLVRDAEGAMCMLLHATGGDPAERPPALNQWMWAELWSRDPDRAAAFYGAVVGYRSRPVVDREGESRLVMGRGGKARAGVVRLPWPEVQPNWVPYLLVDDVPRVLDLVREHGGSVVLAGESDPKAALVADREGAVFGIQEREAK
jgi:predicted enzyme related to lactoylglutathione lyase